jgi:hypothetical protein
VPEVELDPEQPGAVQAAVRALLASGGGVADPWWQAGLEDALAAADAAGQGDTTARPRRTLGAERA